MKSKCLWVFLLFLWGIQAFSQTIHWKVSPGYEDMQVMAEGVIKVQKNNLFGVIDYDGKELAPCSYTTIAPFQEGCALLLHDDKLNGILHENGSVTYIGGKYSVDLSSPFYSEGLLAVKNGDGLWGFMDTAGTIRIKCKFSKAYPFSCGLASVRDTYFMHINKLGVTSYLRDGFNDDDLLFASSFTKTPEGPMAIIVNTKGKLLRRTLSGNKIGKAISGVKSIGGSKKEIKVGDDVFQFNYDWTLKCHINGSIIKNYTHKEYPSGVYTPQSSSITCNIAPNGKYDLRVNAAEVLSAQFDQILPLNDTRCAVAIEGGYGILEVSSEMGAMVTQSESRYVVSHHSAIPITFRIDSLSSDATSSLEDVTVIMPDGKSVSPSIQGKEIQFSYMPLSVGDKSVEVFEVSFKMHGLQYKGHKVSVEFVYEPVFSVIWPSDIIQLDNQQIGLFEVVIDNRSTACSDECIVLIDNRVIGKYMFSPKQKRRIQINKAIDIQDEDQVTKKINLIIREKGCPDFKSSRSIVFERYFINN